MAKIIFLALTFTALLALASAYTTTTFVTTTVEDENRQGSSQQCSRQIQGQRFNQCQRHLQQGIQGQESQQQRQQCCNELQNIDGMCQCEAVRQVYRQVQGQLQQQQGREGRSYGSQQIGQLRQMAQNLPNQCNLQTRQCQVGNNVVITTTTIAEEEEEENTDWSRGSRGSQQCQHVRQQSFNQCQRYVQRQTSGSPRILMSINSPQEQQQEREECCRELRNVEEECQCEAMQQVYRQAQRQQPSRRRGGQQQTGEVRQVVESLRNQCNLQAQQCRISSAMF